MTYRTRLLPAIAGLVLVLAVPRVAHAQAQAARILVSLPGFELPVALDTLGHYKDVTASRGKVYAAVRQAFASLELPMTHTDSTRGSMVNPQLVKMRRIQKQPLSRYFNCGSGLTGPNADHFRVHLAVGAFIDSTSEGTRLRVTAAAGALDVDGASKPPVTCGSTGALEEQIASLASLYLAGSPVK